MAPRTQKNPSKSVSLKHDKTPLINCGHNHAETVSSDGGLFQAHIGYSGTCIHSQWALLNRKQAGLIERVRFYSVDGAVVATNWQTAKFISSRETFFSSIPNVTAHEACEALVAKSNHNDVKYGPVCETI
jgi:hypothetical protein